MLFLSILLGLGYVYAARDPRSLQKTLATKNLVPLEAHIMSKCPDARDCLRMMVLPVMQRAYDKVDFKLSYIGSPTENDGVECMHGAEECMTPSTLFPFLPLVLTQNYEQVSETLSSSAPQPSTQSPRRTSGSRCA